MFDFLETPPESSGDPDVAPAEGGGTPPVPPGPAPAAERAARLKKFARERLIVDYLNRGVSVAEIAARFDVGEKRMRAIVRDIIARRQPHPPEEFLAIQVSRLNEALLVAFSAMSNANLKAVAEVRRLVRDLDRYHGLSGAGRFSVPRLADGGSEPAVDARLTFGAALVRRADFAPQVFDALERGSDEAAAAGSAAAEAKGFYARYRRRGVEDDAPTVAPAESAPEGQAPESRPAENAGAAAAAAFHARMRQRLGAPGAGPAPDEEPAAAPAIRPEIPAESLEKIDSAPGLADRDPRPDLHHEGHEGPQGFRVSSGDLASAAHSTDLILSLSKDDPVGGDAWSLRASFDKLRTRSGVAAWIRNPS